MSLAPITFSAQVWIYSGPSAWYFLDLPQRLAQEIKDNFHQVSRGWGSLPVEVQIGKTIWTTSIFLDRKKGTYLLPLKASVRKEEGIEAGMEVECQLALRLE